MNDGSHDGQPGRCEGADDGGGGALFVVDVGELSESLPMVCSRLNDKAINHKLQLLGAADNHPYE